MGRTQDSYIFKEIDIVNMFVSLVGRKRLKIQKEEEITDIARSHHQFSESNPLRKGFRILFL